jgi:hypothetical protein
VNGRLRHLEAPPAAAVPADHVAFLRTLGGPAAIRVRGRDRTRCRVVVTLMHGNEPSGLVAVHGRLRDGRQPATDTLFVLGAVEAALADPYLSSRLLPDGTDLNRCFGRTARSGPCRDLALAILEAVRAAAPEALVDIHNNTGHNPPYCVAPQIGNAERRLAGFFGDLLVHYDLRIGALAEEAPDVCPTVVTEAGRAGDPAADRTARHGLDAFLDTRWLFEQDFAVPQLDVFHHPVRVEVGSGVRLAYGHEPEPTAQLTIAADLDRHNFQLLPPGTELGWLAPEAPWPLVARGADGADRSHELFALDRARLVARSSIVPIMMTTDPKIAHADCLFYAVERQGTAGRRVSGRGDERPGALRGRTRGVAAGAPDPIVHSDRQQEPEDPHQDVHEL